MYVCMYVCMPSHCEAGDRVLLYQLLSGPLQIPKSSPLGIILTARQGWNMKPTSQNMETQLSTHTHMSVYIFIHIFTYIYIYIHTHSVTYCIYPYAPPITDSFHLHCLSHFEAGASRISAKRDRATFVMACQRQGRGSTV